MKSIFCAFAAMLSLSAFSMTAHAGTVTTVADYTESVNVTYYGGSTDGTDYASASGAVASITPLPLFAIETQAAGNGYVSGGGQYTSASANFTYYFEVAGGVYNTPVNIFLSTDLITQVTGDAKAFSSIDVAGSEVDVCSDGDGGSSCASGTYFNGAIPLTVAAGNQYSVQFELEALADFGFAGTAFASADPYIYVDPNDPNASLYNIVVSNGVSNVPAATPLPAALPLFATGLGVLSLLGWRRTRKAQAAV